MGGAERLEVDNADSALTEDLSQLPIGVIDHTGRVVNTDADGTLASEALIRRGDRRQGPAEAAALVEVLVVDGALRAEDQPALGVVTVAPPHQCAAPAQALRRTEVAAITIDHRSRLDRRSSTGAGQYHTSAHGRGHRLLCW